MSEKKDDKMKMTWVFQDSPDKVERYYVGKQLKFRTKRNTTRYLKGPRYEKQNVNNWERLGIDINRKGGKPPLEDWDEKFDEKKPPNPFRNEKDRV